jgi:hypothetical protein
VDGNLDGAISAKDNLEIGTYDEHPHYPDWNDIAAVDGIGGRRLRLSRKLERSLGKTLLSFRALLFAVSVFQMRAVRYIR